MGTGHQTRDYVYVTDIVEANLVAADAEELHHSVFNIGTGHEVSLWSLVRAITTAAGRDPKSFVPELRPPRAGEVQRNCLDVTRAREHLGLQQSTPIEQGLAATLFWLRSGQPLKNAFSSAEQTAKKSLTRRFV
jgi:UDP-glucose 4-epimerase